MGDFYSSGALSPSQQDLLCEQRFLNGGPFWHICSNGQLMEIIFKSEEDYKFAVNAIAISAAITGVRVIAFQVMSNHLHAVAEGERPRCEAFFEESKRRIRRYTVSQGRYVNYDAFEAKCLPIDNLGALRTEICYVHRTGFLVNSAYTPFSYPWGSGYVYFNASPHSKVARKYSELPKRDKLLLSRSRQMDLPDWYMVDDGMILPESFCSIKYGEGFFRNAQHYFNYVSKRFEAYSEVAKRLGDSVFLTDDELFSVSCFLGKKMFGERAPSMLPPASKIELAKCLRRDYNASEGQIQRMLRLDRSVVRELFGPTP